MVVATKAFIEVRGLRSAMSSRQDELHQKDVTIAFLQRSLAEANKTDSINQRLIVNLKAAKALAEEKAFAAGSRVLDLEYQLKGSKTKIRWSLPVTLGVGFGGGYLLGRLTK